MNITRFCLVVVVFALQAAVPADSAADQLAWVPLETQPAAAFGDPRVEALFLKLRENWDRQDEYARDKWERLPTVEKAQLINRWAAQGTLKGANWAPYEAQAASLVAEQLADRNSSQQPRLEQLLAWVRGNLTPAEKSSFESNQDALISELASLGLPAVDALMARMQAPYPDKPPGLQASWAAEALKRMGGSAVPAICEELDRYLQMDLASVSVGPTVQLLVEALAANPSPTAIPVLRRMLDFSSPFSAGIALSTLAKLPGGISQDTLLDLYENSPKLRSQAASILGDRGDEKAIEVLQRDTPTAYAQARYDAENAAWRIKSRLGMEAGPRPDSPKPLKKTNKTVDYSSLWEGWEKSFYSPNKAIRLEALDHLATSAEEREGDLQQLMAVACNDPHRGVRIEGTKRFARAFALHVHSRETAGKPLDTLNEAFMALVQIIMTGDDDVMAAALMTPAHCYRRFSSQPAYRGIAARILDGVRSSNAAHRAACLGAFVSFGQADPHILDLGTAPDHRKAMSAAVMAGLVSGDERYTVDAIRAAAILRMSEAVPDLISIISSAPHWRERAEAASSLGQIGDTPAIDALQHMADTDPYTNAAGMFANRWAAIRAIEQIRFRYRRDSSGPSTSPAPIWKAPVNP